MFRWTDDTIARMLTLMETYSASETARILGTTKNSVIGKHQRELVRLGKIPPRPSDGVKGKLPDELKGQPQRKPHRKQAPPAPVSTGNVGTILPTLPKPSLARFKRLVGILDVTGCRWPIGEHPKVIGTKVFCNATLRDGSSYCGAHAEESCASFSRELIRRTIRSTLHTLKRRAA